MCILSKCMMAKVMLIQQKIGGGLAVRDNFFTLILKYLFPAPWIHYLEHLEDFYRIRFFFDKIKVIRISLLRFHSIYNRRCEILFNISSHDSSVGRVIGSDPHG